MKLLITSFLITVLSLTTYACSCGFENSFCNIIQSDYFLDNEGMVCLAGPTGDTAEDYDFYGVEMKLIDLMYGTIHSGNGNYLNSDSTFWIVFDQTDTCNDFGISDNPGDQLVIASRYKVIGSTPNGITQMGYSLYLCAHDVFEYQTTILGPIIDNAYFFPNSIWEVDTITATQLPQIVSDCINCQLNLDLSGTHSTSSVYRAGSTINSTAYVNADVVYKADDRISLKTGFKTNQAINFGVVMDGCN